MNEDFDQINERNASASAGKLWFGLGVGNGLGKTVVRGRQGCEKQVPELYLYRSEIEVPKAYPLGLRRADGGCGGQIPV